MSTPVRSKGRIDFSFMRREAYIPYDPVWLLLVACRLADWIYFGTATFRLGF